MFRHRRAVALAALALSIGAGRRADAEDWTRFRGPGGSGISEAATVPVTWTEKDYNWKAKLPGGGHSSPVVWGDKIFVTCADEKTATRILACLKTADGSLLWERRYDSKPHTLNPDNSYAASTPAVDQDRVYAYWTTPEEVALLALDHGGKEVWRRNFGPFVSEHGSGTSPVVFEDIVVVGNDQEGKSFLVGVDCKTGETRWQAERKGSKAAYSTPCLYQPDGAPPELVFTNAGLGMTSLDPKTGKVNWEKSDVLPLRVVGSPAVASGLIVGTCGVGGSGTQFVAVRPGSEKRAAPPELAYKLTKSVPYVPTPVAKGDLLFLWAESGAVTCLRAATGEVVWQQRVEGNFYSSPVWVDGRIYCITRKGEVVVIAASEKFELLARNPLGERTQATAAVAGGVMYLRTYTQLISIGGKK